MKRASAVLASLVWIATALFGQEPGDKAKTPATKLEAFQSRTGIVLIRGYSTIGKVSVMGGQITVDAREFRDGSNPNSPRATGIAITVKEAGRLERENTSFVDAEEIDSLLTGIDYIAKANKEITKLDQFEVDYRTKGDLRITVFSSERGEISAAVSCGSIGRTTAYIKLPELQRVRDLIAAAKTKI